VKTKTITYAVAMFDVSCWPRGSRKQLVEGLAIDLPLPIRVCARKVDGLWQLDDFDTGHCFNSVSGCQAKTLKALLKNCIKPLRKKIESGEYEQRKRAALSNFYRQYKGIE
jgi:hypothetical protein